MSTPGAMTIGSRPPRLRHLPLATAAITVSESSASTPAPSPLSRFPTAERSPAPSAGSVISLIGSPSGYVGPDKGIPRCKGSMSATIEPAE